MSKSFAIKHDFSGLFGALDQIEEGAQINLRPAAQAGAQVLYDEVLLRVPEGKRESHIFHIRGKKYGPFTKGNLRRSIYQVYSEDNSSANRSTYHISWNYRKAPYAHMVEYGTPKAPASPFLRPAYDAKGKVALEVANARWTEDMRQLIASFK